MTHTWLHLQVFQVVNKIKPKFLFDWLIKRLLYSNIFQWQMGDAHTAVLHKFVDILKFLRIHMTIS